MQHHDDALILAQDVWMGFTKDDRRIDVLRGLSLSVGHAETVSIMGRSGSGKSTLLAVLSGVTRPVSGAVSVAGHRMDQLEEGRRADVRLTEIGRVFQDVQLLPFLTAEQNVALAAELTGEKRADALERARALLARVGLEGRERHRPAELSGGEQQRVGVARALINRPRIVLADEPTAAVDEELRDDIADLLIETTRGSAMIIVTHDPTLAERAGRRLALVNGQLRESDDLATGDGDGR